MAGEPGTRVDRPPAGRRTRPGARLRKRAAIAIAAPAQTLGASLSTVRRDPCHLMAAGRVRRGDPAARPEPERAIAGETSRARKPAVGAVAAGTTRPGGSASLGPIRFARAAARALRDRADTPTVTANHLRVDAEIAAEIAIRGARAAGARPGSAA